MLKQMPGEGLGQTQPDIPKSYTRRTTVSADGKKASCELHFQSQSFRCGAKSVYFTSGHWSCIGRLNRMGLALTGKPGRTLNASINQ